MLRTQKLENKTGCEEDGLEIEKCKCVKKISIIIPCYNVSQYIDRCMNSIVDQTIGLDNLEVICVDDASEDDTWIHLQEWEHRFSENIILIHLETNRRQGTARNVGLSYASAEWISFVDADDWLEPDYFEQLYKPTKIYDVDVVSCGTQEDTSTSLKYFNENGRGSEEDEYYIADKKEITKMWLRYKILGNGAWAKIIRRNLIMEHELFFVEGLVYEDHHWIPLLHIYATHAYIIGRKLYHYFMSPDSTVRSRNKDYHIDWITVQMIKWKNYGERKLFKDFREELEEDALDDAVGFMKMLIMRYDQPSFSMFQLEKELINQYVPDYKCNPYINDYIGMAQIFLKMLYSPLNKIEFYKLIKQLRDEKV